VADGKPAVVVVLQTLVHGGSEQSNEQTQ